jgi:predicted nucleotidyltransferase
MNTLNASKREKIITVLTKVLDSEECVTFAYLYGSFVTDNFFRDIDIFIYINEDEDFFVYPVNVKEKLFDAVAKLGIDTFVVDSFDFRNSLVRRYWAVDDRILLNNCKAGHADFPAFVETIERFLDEAQ